MKHSNSIAVGALIAALSCAAAHAGVSPEEAEKLRTTLTPFGAERAGNKDGTIPAWDGGYTKPVPGDKPGGRRGDPFAAEKPLFSINSKNMDQYAARLSDGVKAMLRKYPDTYRVDVYQTHRTAAAPQWVYDNTFKNAIQGKLVDEKPQNVYGGIPFPIPRSGSEIMWNHMLCWQGESYFVDNVQYLFTADGKKVLISDATGDFQRSYYKKNGSPEQFAKDGEWGMARVLTYGPPMRAGEVLAGRFNIDGDKEQSWVYLAGQRRVRKLPNPCCDTPSPFSGGLSSFDETQVWSGRIDRFDWKIIGKQEMYIPYNGNRMMQPPRSEDVMDDHHIKSEYMRWELHRVWIVEADLRAGKRHPAKRSRYYCDEDSWNCVLADRWDANGQLWKMLWMSPIVVPDLPGVVGLTFGFQDLLSGAAYVTGLSNGKSAQMVLKPPYKDSMFTPDAIAGEGVR